jgi:HAD superfamily hydrolase (TIGR01509 family)
MDNFMNIGAVFDWDGVIIDSSAHHEESWERLAKEREYTLVPGHFKKGFGRKNDFIISNILGWTHEPALISELALRKEELYREIVREWGIAPLPGVTEWLTHLKENGIPCVVGSSTHRENILIGLEILRFTEYFAAFVTAEDVLHGKPDPEVFLKAAEKIGRSPEHCVVFEDALVGIEAAHRGGMKAVALATTNPIEALGAADIAVHRLDELTVDHLLALFK